MKVNKLRKFKSQGITKCPVIMNPEEEEVESVYFSILFYPPKFLRKGIWKCSVTKLNGKIISPIVFNVKMKVV